MDILSILKQYNKEEDIHIFSSSKLNWNWYSEIKDKQNLIYESGILIFVGFDGNPIYIGFTECIKIYIGTIRYNVLKNKNIHKVYIILESVDNLFSKTKTYREIFLNKSSMFSNKPSKKHEDYLYVSEIYRDLIEWIIQDSDVFYDEFVRRFKPHVIPTLCRLFNCKLHNLSELQHAIKTNKKTIIYK